MFRAAPSPNQNLSSAAAQTRREERDGVREGWLGNDQMRMFTERLQPQQWLGPSNMAWVRNASW
jgi:hypothetical protein